MNTAWIEIIQSIGVRIVSKILVVEDNPDTRELLHIYFSNAGFSVIDACDGREGLLRARAYKPDLIITDMAMPKVNGYEMIKQLHTEPATTDIPILVFTAHESVTPEKVIEAGADKAFYKPHDFDDLVEVVREMLH
jgi:DNA-binding response OmpR family regulator